MTSLTTRLLGLALAGVVLVMLELGTREFARRHWNSQRGVLWRQAVGHGLILLVATVYCYAFGLPLLPIGAMWVLSFAVLLFLLVIDRADVLQYGPWPGITPKGNLTHSGIRHIENTQSALIGAQQSAERIKLELGHLLDNHERELLMAWLQVGDLRYMRPPCSIGELRKRAEERMSEARVRDEEWQRRQEG